MAPQALRRMWCLWEIFTAVQAGCRVEVAMPADTAERLWAEVASGRLLGGQQLRALWGGGEGGVCSRNAQCSLELDREELAALLQLNQAGAGAGTEAKSGKASNKVDRAVVGALETWAVKEIEMRIARLGGGEGEGGEGLGLGLGLGELGERLGGCENENEAALGLWLWALGRLHYDGGRYGQAWPLLERGIEIARRVHGDDHPTTLTATSSLVDLYMTQGLFTEALDIHNDCLDGHLRVDGPHHPSSLAAMHTLGMLLASLGRAVEAVSAYSACLDAARLSGEGDYSPDIVKAQLALARTLEDLGRKLTSPPCPLPSPST